MIISKSKTTITTSQLPTSLPLREKQNFAATSSPQAKSLSLSYSEAADSTKLFSPNKQRDIIEARVANKEPQSQEKDKYSLVENQKISSTKLTPSAKENNLQAKQHQISTVKSNAGDATQSMQNATKSLTKLTTPCSVVVKKLQIPENLKQTVSHLEQSFGKSAQKSTTKVSSNVHMNPVEKSTSSSSNAVKTPQTDYVHSSFISKANKSTQTSPKESTQTRPENLNSFLELSPNNAFGRAQNNIDAWLKIGQRKSPRVPKNSFENVGTKSVMSLPANKSAKQQQTTSTKIIPMASTASVTSTSANKPQTLQILPLPALPWLKNSETRMQSMHSTPPRVSPAFTSTPHNSPKSTPNTISKTISVQQETPPTRSDRKYFPSLPWLKHVLESPKPNPPFESTSPLTPTRLRDRSNKQISYKE